MRRLDRCDRMIQNESSDPNGGTVCLSSARRVRSYRRAFARKATVTPDRKISVSYDWLRPIGNVRYNLQQRSHTAIDLYAWSRYHEREYRWHRRKSCD